MPADAMARAQELLKSGQLSPEKAEQLRAKMRSYEESRVVSLGDPRNLSGENALEAADRALPDREPSFEEQQQTENKVQLQEYVREGQPKPTWKTPVAKAAQQTLQEQAGGAMSPEDALMASAAEDRARAEGGLQNLGIKNLSKDPELFVPPAYTSSKEQNISAVAPTPQALAMSAMGKETPVSNLGLFGAGPPGTLPGVSVDVPQSIPFLGHDVWYEPSIDQFRRDMGTALRGAGINPDKVTEDDPVYKRYADALWAQRYKEAVQKDESVVRQSQEAERDDPLKGAAALKKGIGFIMGLQKGFGAGAPVEMAAGMLGAPQEEVQTLRQVAESEPAANFIGTGLGALAPTSAPQRLMAGASKAIPAVGAARAAQGLAPTGLDVAGNVLRSTAIGGLTGAGEQVASDTIQNLGDISRGADPTVSLEQMGDNALMAGTFGSAFGAGGEIIGQGARAGKRALLRSSVGHRLQTMENADIEPGLFTRKPKAVKEAQQRTAAAGLGNDVQSQASNELREPIARAWRDISEGGTKEELPQLRHQVDEYFRSPEGAKNKVPLNNTTEAVIDLLNKRTDEFGENLPFLDTQQFKSVLSDLFAHDVVTEGELARLKGAGWRKLPVDPPADKPGMIVAGRPKELNAQEMQTVIERLDKLAGFDAKELTGPKEEAWRAFNKAVRRDRDKFGRNQWTRGPGGGQLEYTTPDGETVTGFSALMAKLSDAKRGADRQLGAAGLSGNAPSLRGVAAERVPAFDEVRVVDKRASDLAPIDELFKDYSSTGSLLPSDQRRALRKIHEKYISDEVLPAVRPRDVMAFKMFTYGYDEAVRAAQRGAPDEEIRRAVEAAKMSAPDVGQGMSVDEYMRRAKLAAQDVEEGIRRAPKATHIPVVFRGVSLNRNQVDRILEDGSFNLGNMTSSFSRNPLMAETFAFKGPAEGNIPVLLKVKHKNGVGIETLSKLRGEEEVLLPGNASFKVTDAYKLKTDNSYSRPVLVIEADEVGKVASGPKFKSAVREGLPLDISERQNQQVDKLIQQYSQTTGQARRDEAALKVARAAGVENELKMWAGIFAMQKGGPREGVAVGQSGIRGWLAGGLPDLALRTNKTLNTLGAKPLGQAPKPSEELRALLRRMAPSVTGADPHPGPSPFNLLGLTSGGGAAFSVGLPSEQSGQLLDPQLYGAVMGNKAKEELVRNLESLSEPEQGVLEQLLEAVGRGISKGMPPPQQVAPEPRDEEVTP